MAKKTKLTKEEMSAIDGGIYICMLMVIIVFIIWVIFIVFEYLRQEENKMEKCKGCGIELEEGENSVEYCDGYCTNCY